MIVRLFATKWELLEFLKEEEFTRIKGQVVFHLGSKLSVKKHA